MKQAQYRMFIAETGGQATPMTYRGKDGKQYVVIAAGPRQARHNSRRLRYRLRPALIACLVDYLSMGLHRLFVEYLVCCEYILRLSPLRIIARQPSRHTSTA